MSRKQAIDIALDALANPAITSFLSVGPLPDGLKCLLRIVAEGEWRDASTEHAYKQHDAQTVRAASAAFLSEVLFARQTDPYRVLGLPPGVPLSDVRENKRLLLKWLHPDRNPENKEREHLTCVIEAAEAIESGRSHQFGKTSSQRSPASFSPSPTRQAVTGAGKARSKAPRASQVLPSIKRAMRETASRSIRSLLSAARLAFTTLAILLGLLIVWRYAMDESIGDSITRYSKLAAGLVAWP